MRYTEEEKQKLQGELRRKIINREKKSNLMKERWASKRYLEQKNRGDIFVSVDVWDLFEKEEYMKVIKESVDLKNRRVLVRFGNEPNIIEVEVSDIEDIEDFDAELKWCKEQVKTFATTYPKIERSVEMTPDEYMEQEKDSVLSPSDIIHGFYTVGQLSKFREGIENGVITLEDINQIQSRKHTSELLQLSWGRKERSELTWLK